MMRSQCNQALYENLLESEGVKEFSTFDYDFIDQYAQHNKVLSDIKLIYENEFGNDPFIEKIESLVGSSVIRGSYKKAMCHILFENYRNRFFNIPKTPVPFWKATYNKIKSVAQFVVYPLWILYQIGLPSFRKKATKSYQCGIRVSCCDCSFKNKYRSFDFLIDNNEITAENVLFCIEEPISQEYQNAIDSRGYHSVHLREVLKGSDISFIYRVFLKKQFPVWLNLLLRSLTKPPFMLILTLEIMYKSLLWSKLLEDYHVQHYVVFNDDLPADIVRYIHCNQNNTQTWFYIHSCNTNDFLTPLGREDVMDTLYAFYATHHLVVWGRKMENYYKKHPNYVKNFDLFGCLWSELIRSAQERPASNAPRIKINEKCSPKKIIGVFDTSFTETCPLSYKDMILFVEGLLQLLDDFPDVGIIFKNKNSLKLLSEHVPHIIPYYQKLRDHPHCYFPDVENTDPTECVAASDLIISAPFTSSSIEALGAGIKAIYYDASHRFPGCYYDRFPRFVAHNYDELKDFVEYWLYGNTLEEFEMFLNTHIKEEIHEYVDGKAITRFRQQLSRRH
jgi:polysaccharide biosynthesis PFTS motif protein